MSTNLLQLTPDNYYSKQADMDYMSVSQFKGFAGTLYNPGCETKALARLKGTYPDEPSTDKLVGSYIDAAFEGTLSQFVQDHVDLIHTKTSIKKFEAGKGALELLAPFNHAEEIIARLQSDKVFMEYCQGQKQVVMIGEIFGVPWKIRMDFYDLVNQRITDLKIMRNMAPVWSPAASCKIDFIRYWGYDIQGAIYQEIVRQNTGLRMPFYLNVGTKENPADLAVIHVTQNYLDEAAAYVASKIVRVVSVKNGTEQPVPCGSCDYCRSMKSLAGPIPMSNIVPVNRYTTYDPDMDPGDEE